MSQINRGLEIQIESFINPQSAISTPYSLSCMRRMLRHASA